MSFKKIAFSYFLITILKANLFSSHAHQYWYLSLHTETKFIFKQYYNWHLHRQLLFTNSTAVLPGCPKGK